MTVILNRLALSIRFNFRPGKRFVKTPGRYASLYIMLTLNAVPAKSKFSSGIKVPRDLFDQKAQRVKGDSEEARLANAALQDIRDAFYQLLQQQRREGNVTPSAETLRVAWTTPIQTIPGVVELYGQYIAYLRDVEQRKLSTINKWLHKQTSLRRFVKAAHRLADVPLELVTVKWAKDFEAYLQRLTKADGTPRIRRNTVVDYVKALRPVLDYAVEQGHLSANPLHSLKLRPGRGKEIYYLEEEHLLRLATLPLTGQSAILRDMALLMAYTGLDYVDLYRVLERPATFVHALLSGGQKLIVRRAKTGVDAQIPLLPGVRELLDRYAAPNRVPPHYRSVNRKLRDFEQRIGFSKRLTCKILRKTCGALFLNAGYTIELVSHVLGHSNTRITQRHYVTINDKRVDLEISRVGTVAVPLSQTMRLPSLQA